MFQSDEPNPSCHCRGRDALCGYSSCCALLICQLLSLLNEAVGIGLEAELLVCGSITTCDLMRVFLSNLAGFNAIGLFGRADLVSLVSGVQNACKIEGASEV